jgi:serine protease Do
VNGAVPLLEKVAAATVNIHTQIPASHPSVAIGLGTDRRGTGTLVSADGLIVTVNYMIMGAEHLLVTFADGRQVPGRVVARDFTTSLGVVQAEGGGKYPFLDVTSSATASLGQEVLILSSLGAEKRCADTGIITYLGPFDAAWEFVLERCVCVTASALNIGLSGGPILNSRGQVLAFCYLNFSDLVRPILAIPGECFLSGRDELVRHGHRVSSPPKLWLGVLSYTLREHVVIAGVMPGSPGEKAGLQQGDLVLSADGREIHERRALYDAINTHRPGERIQLRILRKNQVYDLEIPAIIVDDFLG